jgi:hypothetical protein
MSAQGISRLRPLLADPRARAGWLPLGIPKSGDEFALCACRRLHSRGARRAFCRFGTRLVRARARTLRTRDRAHALLPQSGSRPQRAAPAPRPLASLRERALQGSKDRSLRRHACPHALWRQRPAAFLPVRIPTMVVVGCVGKSRLGLADALGCFPRIDALRLASKGDPRPARARLRSVAPTESLGHVVGAALRTTVLSRQR